MLPASLVVVGIALRLWQYLADTSMWFDEFSIARNVSERSLGALLTRPLGFAQTAPLGFIAAIDVSSNVLGPSDLALRFFPFLCGIAGLFLFWRVAETTLTGGAVAIAIALFALSTPLIRYSAELKQYGGDVVAILGLTLVALDPPIASLALKPPPYTVEQFKPVLAFVQAHRRNGDRIYVYTNAYQAVARYGEHYGMPAGSYDLGVCDESGYRAFYEDIDRFRGVRRLWVIGSSVPDFYPARRALGRYLQTIGVRRDSLFMPSTPPMSPVSAELFDLSDAARLRSAEAATFQVKPDTLGALCFDWIRPTPAAG
ncbi:MAG: hypothetical protein JJD97_02760 [Gemmatimonadaceae bacterium]|nr:hypothetical protein [Gemmatimonadaceae bacterium]